MSDIKFRAAGSWRLLFLLFARPIPTIRKVLDKSLLGSHTGAASGQSHVRMRKSFQHNMTENCFLTIARYILCYVVHCPFVSQQSFAGISSWMQVFLQMLRACFDDRRSPQRYLLSSPDSFSSFGAELSSNLCALAWRFATPHPFAPRRAVLTLQQKLSLPAPFSAPRTETCLASPDKQILPSILGNRNNLFLQAWLLQQIGVQKFQVKL